MTSTQPATEVADDLLVELSRRAPMFEALREQSLSAPALERRLNMSRSTIHRATQSLEERGLLRKSDNEFELTGLGRVAAARIADVQSDLDAATNLEPFLNTIENAAVDIPIGRFADAEVTHPQSRQVHFGVKRIVECIESTDSLRMFSSIISPFYVEVAHREMLEGTEIEVIFDVDITDLIGERYTEQAVEAARTGRFDVYVHDDVPFELFLFDDSVGMAAHDDDGIARALVESDAPEAIEWAEDVYRQYKEAAEPLDLLGRKVGPVERA